MENGGEEEREGGEEGRMGVWMEGEREGEREEGRREGGREGERERQRVRGTQVWSLLTHARSLLTHNTIYGLF